MKPTKPNPDDQARDRSWDGLYKAGGVTALILVAIPLVQLVVFAAAPPPLEGSAAAWFALFQENAVLGLLGFEILLVIYSLLSLVLSLALFAALRRGARSLGALFLVSSLIGAIAFVVARPAFEMLYLSGQYAAAASEAQRAVLLGAGEAMVATFHGTAFQVSYLLGSITGFLVGAAMLRGGVFSRTTATIRIASAVFDFGIFIPGIGLYISILSVLLLLAFHILVGRRLLQLASMGRAPGRPVRGLSSG
jgi:hypothetical protein